jgi:D-galactarolactone isomerase
MANIFTGTIPALMTPCTPARTPDFDALVRTAKALIARYPQRCVWATNWPHPSKPGNPPDDAHLLDLFAGWCGSDATFRQVLVENPAALYGF